MEIPECFYRVSVKALILDETRTKFLLMREDNGCWELPGGGLDHTEDIEEGLRRELLEEGNFAIESINPEPKYVYKCLNSRNEPTINVLYEVKLKTLDFTPTDECEEVRFYTTEEAEKLKTLSNIKVFSKLYKSRN
jgi:8-oxo-dGTP diphosphatase